MLTSFYILPLVSYFLPKFSLFPFDVKKLIFFCRASPKFSFVFLPALHYIFLSLLLSDSLGFVMHGSLMRLLSYLTMLSTLVFHAPSFRPLLQRMQ